MEKYDNEDYKNYINYLKRKKQKGYNKNSQDLHIHSEYSFDSSMTLRDIVKCMEEKKVSYIGITDHVEFSNNPVHDIVDSLKRRNEEIDALAEETPIKIIKGVEVSEPHRYYKEMEALRKIKDLDMIIGSIHHLKNRKLRELPNNQTTVDLYFKEILKMVKEADIDVIGHLDYIKKVIFYYDIDYDLLDEILLELITNQITLEINSSGIRRCNGKLFPDNEIITEYIKHGGEYITLGSDAHNEQELYYGIPEAKDITKNLALTPVIYQNRHAIKMKASSI